METTRYRSYVVRVWSVDEEHDAAGRVLVEEIRSGVEVELRGHRATDLARAIDAALASRGDETAPPTGEPVHSRKERPG